ncbi:15742_t:CDS:1, partial [Racocetra persica]
AKIGKQVPSNTLCDMPGSFKLSNDRHHMCEQWNDMVFGQK